MTLEVLVHPNFSRDFERPGASHCGDGFHIPAIKNGDLGMVTELSSSEWPILKRLLGGLPNIQWEFRDPKMEVLYPYIGLR